MRNLLLVLILLTPVTIGTGYKYTDNTDEVASSNEYYRELRLDVITRIISNAI